MKNLLKLEELAQFLLVLFALYTALASWWVFLLLLIGPDISMLGYLVNTRIGAVAYNLFHHKGVAILVIMLAQVMRYGLIGDCSDELMTIGLVLYGHASLDRIFGYGLKFGDSFRHTHLGWIGKSGAEGRRP